MRRARILRADHRRRRCKPVQVGCTATGTCTCEALVPCVRSSSMHTMGRDCVLVVQNELCFVSYSSSTVTRFGGLCRPLRRLRSEERQRRARREILHTSPDSGKPAGKILTSCHRPPPPLTTEPGHENGCSNARRRSSRVGRAGKLRCGCTDLPTTPWPRPARLHVGRAARQLVEGGRQRLGESPQ